MAKKKTQSQRRKEAEVENDAFEAEEENEEVDDELEALKALEDDNDDEDDEEEPVVATGKNKNRRSTIPDPEPEEDDEDDETDDEEDDEVVEIGFAPFIVTAEHDWELEDVLTSADVGENIYFYVPPPTNKEDDVVGPAKWYKLVPIKVGETPE